MSAGPSASRHAMVLVRLVLAVVLAAVLVAVAVMATRTPLDGAVTGVSSQPADPTDGTATGADTAEPGTAGDASPQIGLAAAAVAAAQSVAGQAGFAAGSASAAPIGSTVAVWDRATSEVAVGAGGGTGVLSASLSKLVLAVDVLDRRHAEGLPVTDVDIRLLQRALGPSDDAAMSALWSRFDGPGAAERMSVRIGLQDTIAPRDPSQWGELEVTASDLLLVWQHVLDAMPAADRDLLIGAMAAAPARATDGFDQAYGLLAPGLPTEVGAAKQGWMCCIGGSYHLHRTHGPTGPPRTKEVGADFLHSVGVLGSGDRFVVAVLTTSPAARGWEAARRIVDDMVAAAAHALAQPTAG